MTTGYTIKAPYNNIPIKYSRYCSLVLYHCDTFSWCAMSIDPFGDNPNRSNETDRAISAMKEYLRTNHVPDLTCPYECEEITRSQCVGWYNFVLGKLSTPEQKREFFQEYYSIFDQLSWDLWHRAIDAIPSGDCTPAIAQTFCRMDNIFRRQLWVERSSKQRK